MMNGITILHQYQTNEPDLGLQIFLGVLAIVALGLVAWNIIRRLRKQKPFMDTGNSIFMVVFAAAMFAICVWVGSWEPYTEYKVTIDESVSYVEFVENYQVLDQEGSIYTIREIDKGE